MIALCLEWWDREKLKRMDHIDSILERGVPGACYSLDLSWRIRVSASYA